MKTQKMIGVFLAVFICTAVCAWAEVCVKCKDGGYTADIGKCVECAGDTSSGAFKLCKQCSTKLGQCEHCRAALAAKKPANVAVIQEWAGETYTHLSAGKRLVVQDQQAWEEAWSFLHQGLPSGRAPVVPEPPKIDFKTRTVVAVVAAPGGSVLITGITSDENGKVLVTVKESGPPEGVRHILEHPSPYHVVVIPKTNKPIEFADKKK